MNKKYLIILIAVIACAGLFAYPKANAQRSQNTVVVSASWHDHFFSAEEMAENSDIVVGGVLDSSYTELRGNLVFTRSQILVERVYAGDCTEGTIIEVLQTGGDYKDHHTAPISESPLIEPSTKYLLMLSLTEPDDRFGQYYLISGGYQGMVKVSEYPAEEDLNGAFDPVFDMKH